MSEYSTDSEREIMTAPELIAALGDRWPALRRRFDRACKALNEVLAEVRAEQPEANLYLDGSQSLFLMSGPAHDGSGEHAQQQRIMHRANLHAGGGDW